MEKKSQSNPLPDSRLIFVGDDTGLLKKLKMTMSIEDDIISMPSKKKKSKKRTLEEMTADEGLEDDEDEEFKEEAVIRKKADIQFKVLGKSGEQAKDEGLQFLTWSLGNNNNDYITYVRGKSNVV